jgi:hypothetical protein
MYAKNTSSSTGRLEAGLFSKASAALAFFFLAQQRTALANETLSPSHVPVIDGFVNEYEWESSARQPGLAPLQLPGLQGAEIAGSFFRLFG